jgi:hypothetical protein
VRRDGLEDARIRDLPGDPFDIAGTVDHPAPRRRHPGAFRRDKGLILVQTRPERRTFRGDDAHIWLELSPIAVQKNQVVITCRKQDRATVELLRQVDDKRQQPLRFRPGIGG